MQTIKSLSDKCKKCGSWFQFYKGKITCRNCGAEAQFKPYKRWRFWRCIEGGANARRVEANEEIEWLKSKGFKAKVWAPLPQHKTSGHTHVVVLCTILELFKLSDLPIPDFVRK